MLPCNVIVYEDDGGAVVSIMDPITALDVVGNERLEPIAAEARERLERVIRRLSQRYVAGPIAALVGKYRFRFGQPRGPQGHVGCTALLEATRKTGNAVAIFSNSASAASLFTGTWGRAPDARCR